MKILIIGAAGFVGGYLIDEFRGCDVVATKLPFEKMDSTGCRLIDLDILAEDDIRAVIEETAPDGIIHLAAQSSVALSWEKPALTVEVNIKGTLNLLEALRKIYAGQSGGAGQGSGAGHDCAATGSSEGVQSGMMRTLLIGSGEEYGKVAECDNPIGENAPVHPANIYAATKACQNMLGKIYSDAYGLDIMMVRAFNHIGPDQGPAMVVSDFCKQAAEIEAGLREPVIYTGNLGARRDFTDVRDVVRAYRLLIEKGRRGEVYNVGSGRAVGIDEILGMIISASKVKIDTAVDKAKLRPLDVPVIEADTRKLAADTGWAPQIPLEQTIADVLAYWRHLIPKSGLSSVRFTL